MKNFIYLFILMLLISCKENDKLTLDVQKYIQDILKYKSYDYDVNYRIKFFSSKDTSKYKVHCTLIRDKKDSIFGGAIWIDNDSVERFYDLKNIYLINHKLKTITKFDPLKGEFWAIKNHAVGECYKVYFLKPTKLLNPNICIGDTIIKSEEYKTISILNKKENYSKNIFIKNKEIQKIKFKAKDIKQKQNQYNEWEIYNSTYNKLTIDSLKKKLEKYRKIYKLEDFKKPKPKELIKANVMAPSIKGSYFPSKNKFNLNEQNNKVKILDFWYKDCDFCIQSIPFLSKLDKKYSKKGLKILALNPINTSDSIGLSEFIKNNKINYDVVLIDKKYALNYNITGFPTFYILNKKNKIIYSHSGYKKENEKDIERIITDELKLLPTQYNR